MGRVIRVVNGERVFGTIGCKADVPNTLFLIAFLQEDEDEYPWQRNWW